MSFWKTLHIATLNPETLPSGDVLKAAINCIKSAYTTAFEEPYQFRYEDIIFCTYPNIRSIERAESFFLNDNYLHKLPEHYCPDCRVSLKTELIKFNTNLAANTDQAIAKINNQFGIPYDQFDSKLLHKFSCPCNKCWNPNEVAGELMFGRFEIIDSLYHSYWEEHYPALMKELEIIFGEPLLRKIQISED